MSITSNPLLNHSVGASVYNDKLEELDGYDSRAKAQLSGDNTVASSEDYATSV